MKKAFHLFKEPWIVALRHDGATEEVSLSEIFRRAPTFKRLAGELPTQDIAVMRLLLAILYSVISRYDLEENYAPLYEESSSEQEQGFLVKAALERWQELWKRGEFPDGLIQLYLTHYEERFWLFHPVFPFYQVADLGKATDYTAAKLNGELAESGNKIRLFASRGGAAKDSLSYAEASRWLLYVNGFDDTSAKPKGKNLPSPGAGWLGKLGLVVAAGNNLFETLMLNLVMLKNGVQPWKAGQAVWEMEKVRRQERCEIIRPGNPAELLTLQSRRLLLKRENERVIGYSLLGGDFFPPENADDEQMTVWRNSATNKNAPPEFKPKRHDPSRQMWRDLSAYFVDNADGRRPGVIAWLNRLIAERRVFLSRVQLHIASVQYGDKDFFIDDVFSDGLAFPGELLSHLGEAWLPRIHDEVQVADALAQTVGRLVLNLAKASGETDGGRLKQAVGAAREQAYFRLDRPFRNWLEDIDPNEEPDDASARWWVQAQSIVRELGREHVDQCDSRAIVGRFLKENETERRYTATEAYDRFLYFTGSREVAFKGGKA